MKTLIFVPTYNEADNVTALVEGVFAQGLDADLLVCDDGSPDGTGDIADALKARFPRLLTTRRPGKLGVGSAHLDGIAFAYDHGYQRLVTMDCDGTHAPDDIPRLLAASDDADVVTGSRFLTADSLPGWSFYRRSMTHLGHIVTEGLLGLTNDATGAFRVYRLDRLPREVFALVTEHGYAFFLQSLFILNENGARIVDVATKLPARTYGHSKMSLSEVRRSVERIVKIAVAKQSDPTQFRVQKDVDLDPSLAGHDDWGDYWTKKNKTSSTAYAVVATAYRNLFIKRNLHRVIHEEFQRGARLLHAGCGSGQVDQGLHDFVDITAVDLSPAALKRYRLENPDAHEVRHADITRLPFDDGAFDGVYNLGVVEHFDRSSLPTLLRELRRVTRKDGKVAIFWPHEKATSAFVLDGVHFIANDVLHKGLQLHPPEPSRLHGRGEVEQLFGDAGIELTRYEFGPRDLFVQAIAVGRVL
jgi:dolichol-phosphate mannosyltransferase